MLRAHTLLRAGRGTFTSRALPLVAAAAAARWPPLSLNVAAATAGLINAGCSGGFRLAHSDIVPPDQQKSGSADGGAANVRSRAAVGGKQRREANGRDMPKQRNSDGRLSGNSGRANGDAPPNYEPASHAPSNREARHRQNSNQQQSNQSQPTHRSADSHAHSPHIAKLLGQLSDLQRKYTRTFPTMNSAIRKGTDDVTSKSEWVAMQQEAKQVSTTAAAAWTQSPQA